MRFAKNHFVEYVIVALEPKPVKVVVTAFIGKLCSKDEKKFGFIIWINVVNFNYYIRKFSECFQ